MQLQQRTPQCFSTSDKKNSPCDLNIPLSTKCWLLQGNVYYQVIDFIIIITLFFFFFGFCHFHTCKHCKHNGTWISPTSSPITTIQSVHLPFFYACVCVCSVCVPHLPILSPIISSPHFYGGNWKKLGDIEQSRATKKVFFSGMQPLLPWCLACVIPVWISLPDCSHRRFPQSQLLQKCWIISICIIFWEESFN